VIATLSLTFLALLRRCAATGICGCQKGGPAHEAQDEPYDAADDFSRSIDEA